MIPTQAAACAITPQPFRPQAGATAMVLGGRLFHAIDLSFSDEAQIAGRTNAAALAFPVPLLALPAGTRVGRGR